MAADIVKAAYDIVAATYGDDRFAEQIKRVVIAGRWNIAVVADELPAAPKDRTLLELKEIGVVINPTGQAQMIIVDCGGLSER